MNLTEQMKEPLRKKSYDQKRKMLAMQYKGSFQVMLVYLYNTC